MLPAEGIQLEMGFSTVSHLGKKMATEEGFASLGWKTKQTSLRGSQSNMDGQHRELFRAHSQVNRKLCQKDNNILSLLLENSCDLSTPPVPEFGVTNKSWGVRGCYSLAWIYGCPVPVSPNVRSWPYMWLSPTYPLSASTPKMQIFNVLNTKLNNHICRTPRSTTCQLRHTKGLLEYM